MNGSFWELLDTASRYRLLVSGHGKAHLLETANLIINSAQQNGSKAGLLDLGVDLLLAAWESSPLDGQLATNLLSINKQMNFIPKDLAELLTVISKSSVLPQSLSYFQKLVQKDDKDKLLDYLFSQTARQPDNIFWLGHLLDLSFFMGKYDFARQVLSRDWPSGIEAVVNKYKGDLAFCSGDYEQAEFYYSDVSADSLPLGESLLRSAEALDRMGRREEALILWGERLKVRPWQVNTWLKMYDRLVLGENNSALQGEIALCLYTYEKGADLERTLESVRCAGLSNVHVFVLNNGSTDCTSDVLSSWKNKLGDKMTVIELPVNIGAPAARNWLKNLPEMERFDFVAYLDDDAVIPVDWQTHFRVAVDAYPDAGVWGCMVVDDGYENILQHADLHLRETAAGFEDSVRSFEFAYFDSYNQDLDYGQFEYCRTCLSVTGCFHLFRRDVLQQSEDFDLRYSPTQYDDLDHDLMLAREGKTVVYQGALKVKHKRKSGSAVRLNRAAKGSGLGNVLKLESKFNEREISKIIERNIGELESDFSAKALKLSQLMKG